MRQHQCRGGITSNDDEGGLLLVDQRADERHHAADELRLAMRAVREERVIGHIDVAYIRPRRPDLAKDREAAQAGIEHEDGRMLGHGPASYAKNCAAATDKPAASCAHNEKPSPLVGEGGSDFQRKEWVRGLG